MADRGHEVLSHPIATISSGTTSGAVDIGNQSIVGLETPALLSSTSLTFTVCDKSDGTFVALKNPDGTAISITCTSSAERFSLDPADFAGVRFIKVIAGSSETSKTFKIISRRLQ